MKKHVVFSLRDSFVIQVVLHFLCDALGIITVTWLPANGDLNKQVQSVRVGEKVSWHSGERTLQFKLSHFSCHSQVLTYQKHMPSPSVFLF